jgi:predicted dithiol-disulfide oxidoreductase (DUF899 family)
MKRLAGSMAEASNASGGCPLRGIDMVNGAYQFLDLVPKGRDEDRFKFPMLWVRRHDQY